MIKSFYMQILEKFDPDYDGIYYNGDVNIVIVLHYENCDWCNAFRPIYKKISEEFKDQNVEFYSLSLFLEEQEKEFFQVYDFFGALSLPTIIFASPNKKIEVITQSIPSITELRSYVKNMSNTKDAIDTHK